MRATKTIKKILFAARKQNSPVAEGEIKPHRSWRFISHNSPRADACLQPTM